MDTTALKAYRDKLRASEKNIALRMYCDNGIVIDEGFSFVKWDDDHNVLIQIKSNEDQVNHMGVKIKTVITDYDMIQYIIAYSTARSVGPLAKSLGYTQEQIDHIIDKFDNQDERTYLNTTPKEVVEAIMKERDEEHKKAAEIREKQDAYLKKLQKGI